MKKTKMKITKFAQSCLLIEAVGKKILVDPGSIQYNDSLLKRWKGINILLITHKHQDHCHLPAIQAILKQSNPQFYTTKEVAQTIPQVKPQIVEQGDIIVEDALAIQVVEAIHGNPPFLQNTVIENVGYIIDDGNTRAYITSDTVSFPNDYTADFIFMPVNNHELVFSPEEAAAFAKKVKPRLVIPIHYDNPKYPVDMAEVKKAFDKQKLKIKVLELYETMEI